MAISYKKLWKMLIDKDLSKTELTQHQCHGQTWSE